MDICEQSAGCPPHTHTHSLTSFSQSVEETRPIPRQRKLRLGVTLKNLPKITLRASTRLKNSNQKVSDFKSYNFPNTCLSQRDQTIYTRASQCKRVTFLSFIKQIHVCGIETQISQIAARALLVTPSLLSSFPFPCTQGVNHSSWNYGNACIQQAAHSCPKSSAQ